MCAKQKKNPFKPQVRPSETAEPTAVNPSLTRKTAATAAVPKIRKITEVIPLFPLSLFQRAGWQLLFFVVLAFVLYGNTFTHEFALDDRIVYTENKFVKEGLAGWGKILQYDTFLGYFGEKQEKLLEGGRYRPLSLLTFAAEYEFFKTPKGEPNPFTGHLFNVLIYAGSLMLFLIFLRRFILKNPVISFLAVLIFAVHPVHTEVVANIKSRDELLGMFLCISALYGALWAIEEPRKRIWALALGVVSFGLAILAKENALAYLFIIPFTFYYFARNANLKVQAAFVLPFVLVIAGYLAFRSGMEDGLVTETKNSNVMNDPFLLIPKTEGKIHDEQKRINEQYGGKYREGVNGEKTVDFASYNSYKYGTVMYVLGRYVKLLFIPHPLVWDYSYPQLLHVSDNLEYRPHLYRKFGEPAVMFSLIFYLTIFGFAVWGATKKSPASWALWFYLFTLFIVSNIAVNIGGFMAERFLYQSSFGFAIVLAIGIAKLNEWSFIESPQMRRFTALFLAGLAVTAGAVLTIVRNPYWKNDHTLFLQDVKHHPYSAHTHKTAGGAWFRMATDSTDKSLTPEIKNAYIDSSVKEYQEALKLYPQFPDVQRDIVVVYRYQNPIYDQKNVRWVELLNYHFDGSWPHTDPAKAKSAFEYARNSRNELLTAAEKMQEALYYEPTNADYWYILAAKIYFPLCNYDQASRCLVKCTQIQPNNANYWHDLGVAYHNNHSFNDAERAFLKCRELNPNFGPLAASLQKTRDEFKKEGKSYVPLPFPIYPQR